MSLLIEKDLVVSIHYELKDDSGNELDSSKDSEPLNYLHGAGNIIPGLEKALVGKVQGDSMQIRLDPEDGYGEVREDLIQTVEKEAFKGVESVEEGMAFEAKSPDGTSQRILVTKVEGDQVTVDANHPLAGVVLNFDVEVVGVREATAEEKAHGHVH